MILYYQKQGGQLTVIEQPQPGCWVKIIPPFSTEELEQVAARYDIPLDFLTDSLDVDERSRYEREDDVRLIVVNSPLLNEADDENEAIYITVPIGIVLVPEHVITISSYENPVLQRFSDGKVKGFDPAREQEFVLQLLENNVHRFTTCLKRLNSKRNLIEQELYDSSRNRELRQLLRIEKSLVYFVTALSSNDLLKHKMKRVDFLQLRADEDHQDHFEDILIDNSQALEMANTYTNILSGTMDAVASIISNNLNVVIQRLTLITIILTVPMVVSGFFGMNVRNGLEESPYAFLYLIGASVILSLFLAWFFRRKRMF